MCILLQLCLPGITSYLNPALSLIKLLSLCLVLSLCVQAFIITFKTMHLHLFISMSRRRQWHPTPVLLPGESHGRKSLVGCSTWGCEGRTRLSDFPFTFHFHALEKEMATHSSVLALRIPGTGEPGGLPSQGSQSRTRLKRLSSRSSSISMSISYLTRQGLY